MAASAVECQSVAVERDLDTVEGCVSTHLQMLGLRISTTLAATEQVCRKCAVRFGPVCAKVRLFNTTAKRFRAGLVWGKPLIFIGEGSKSSFRNRPTLNQ